jgi:cell division protein FtsL
LAYKSYYFALKNQPFLRRLARKQLSEALKALFLVMQAFIMVMAVTFIKVGMQYQSVWCEL